MPKLNNKKTKIGIIGLGYVGLPLAIEFSKKYKTIGYDKNTDRINSLRKGKDYTLEVSKHELINSSIYYSSVAEDLSDCDVYIVTVPTPVDKKNNPEMSALRSASELVGKLINESNIVIYESTVYPGATEEYCVPIIEKKSGLKCNINFFCGYSPERINPGDKKHTLTKITKLVSGSNKKAANLVESLYNSIIPAGTYKTSSISIAESAKVIENIQRDVNIALINELSMLFNKLDLDTNEVLEAAGTKWNFLPFRPGLVGGHCIGVDPYYLTHKASKIGYHPEMILAGRKINDGMGKYIAQLILENMQKTNMNIKESKIAIFGFTFKEDCPDIRNTRIPDIINNLKDHVGELIILDPLANSQEAMNTYNIKLYNDKHLSEIDVAILSVSHKQYFSMDQKRWQSILKNNGLLIDVKSIYPNDYFIDTNIVHLRI